MSQQALLEPLESFTAERFLRGPSSAPHSLRTREAEDIAAKFFSPRPAKICRSAERSVLNVPLWITSLHRPAVFEVLSTENVSEFGVQMISQRPWKPAEQVLVSSPPEFGRSGCVVYCKKLPSEDYLVGIQLDGPVEDWIEPRTTLLTA